MENLEEFSLKVVVLLESSACAEMIDKGLNDGDVMFLRRMAHDSEVVVAREFPEETGSHSCALCIGTAPRAVSTSIIRHRKELAMELTIPT